VPRLEKFVAERTEKPRVCRCRVQTRFRSEYCLDAMLKEFQEFVPVTAFENLGFSSRRPGAVPELQDLVGTGNWGRLRRTSRLPVGV
jgi:hypothetical protein